MRMWVRRSITISLICDRGTKDGLLQRSKVITSCTKYRASKEVTVLKSWKMRWVKWETYLATFSMTLSQLTHHLRCSSSATLPRPARIWKRSKHSKSTGKVSRQICTAPWWICRLLIRLNSPMRASLMLWASNNYERLTEWIGSIQERT